MPLGAILGLVSSIAGGLISSGAHKKERSALEQMKAETTVPASTQRAANIMEEQAYAGLPGYEQMKEEAATQVPTTLNQMRDFVSGPQLMSYLTNLYTQSNKSQREIDMANAAAKQAVKTNYASFLGSTVAPQEAAVQQQKLGLSLAQMQSKSEEAKDKLSYATQGMEAADPMNILKMLGSADYSSLFSSLLARKNQSTENLKPTLPGTATFDEPGFDYIP